MRLGRWGARWSVGGCGSRLPWAPAVARQRSLTSYVVKRRQADNALDMTDFEPSLVRNFSIIAHVDSGKTTLSQRFLQECGAVGEHYQGLFLNQLEVSLT